MSTDTAKAARLATLTAELDTPEPVDDRPAGVRRLEAARAAAAADNDTQAPASAGGALQPGLWVHSLDESGISIMRSASIFGAASVTLYRGDEIEIDQAMLDADIDRFGNRGWTALVRDEEGQVERWGSVRLRVGRAAPGIAPWTYGSALWSEMRERARREAWALPTAEARTAALAEVQRAFGDPPTTSVTLNTARTPSERAAEEQAERIRIATANGSRNIGPSRAGSE